MKNLKKTLKWGRLMFKIYVFSSIVLLLSSFLQVDYWIYKTISYVVIYPALIIFLHKVNRKFLYVVRRTKNK